MLGIARNIISGRRMDLESQSSENDNKIIFHHSSSGVFRSALHLRLRVLAPSLDADEADEVEQVLGIGWDGHLPPVLLLLLDREQMVVLLLRRGRDELGQALLQGLVDGVLVLLRLMLLGLGQVLVGAGVLLGLAHPGQPGEQVSLDGAREATCQSRSGDHGEV